MKHTHGFTLIELMIVIAILGILIAIALPAYQDYTIRAKVSEGINLAAAAKLASSETRFSTGAWPTSAPLAGYAPARTRYVSSIDIPAAQDIVIVYDTTATGISELGSSNTLVLRGSIEASGQVATWECLAFGKSGLFGAPSVAPTLLAKYAPSNCR